MESIFESYVKDVSLPSLPSVCARKIRDCHSKGAGAGIRQIVADRSEWGNPQARSLFLEGARLAGMPE
jgi:hypothetical protein